ncbi:hypothetical protein [Kroppenstedtia sanguinis]|uniref:Uncharacterized protein n=1 Tax=Kroppenstedtia sanguinis TaxID=1380684 RepID=A0ABW4CA77_9BACL
MTALILFLIVCLILWTTHSFHQHRREIDRVIVESFQFTEDADMIDGTRRKRDA